jgi:hypothetical protein
MVSELLLLLFYLFWCLVGFVQKDTSGMGAASSQDKDLCKGTHLNAAVHDCWQNFTSQAQCLGCCSKQGNTREVLIKTDGQGQRTVDQAVSSKFEKGRGILKAVGSMQQQRVG